MTARPEAGDPASPAAMTDFTVLEHRPGVAAAYEARNGAAAILTAYNEMQGPASIGPALHFVCEHARFRIGHLPGLRDAASRLVLARRLIREGYLRVAADQSTERPVTLAEEKPLPRPGSLVVTGSGIKCFAQMTLETLGWLDRADVVMYCLSDPVTGAWIRQTYPGKSVDLGLLYQKHASRFDVYDEMVETMLAPVRQGLLVCSVYYGHPGVFVMPTHRAVELARQEGHQAWMLPGVSATDCLYAELGSDPSAAGCQYYEATDLLIHRRTIHPDNNVVIWQIGVVGNTSSRYDENKLPILIEYLLQSYAPDCEVLHYQGSVFPGCDSVVERIPLRELGQGAKVSTMSTLYIPAQTKPVVDMEMAFRLGMVKGAPGDDESAAAIPKEAEPAPPADRAQPNFGPLARLFYDCARDPALLFELEANPRGVAARAGLSADETTALLSKMPGRIWAAVENA